MTLEQCKQAKYTAGEENENIEKMPDGTLVDDALAAFEEASKDSSYSPWTECKLYHLSQIKGHDLHSPEWIYWADGHAPVAPERAAEPVKLVPEATPADGPPGVTVTVHQGPGGYGGSLDAVEITANHETRALVTGAEVSTGRPGHLTGTGCTMAFYADKDHHSSVYPLATRKRKAGGAPMPYAVAFQHTPDGTIYLHVGDVKVHSHGCVHLTESVASELFDAYGRHAKNFKVCVE